MTRQIMTDEAIMKEIRSRSDEELIAFRNKLKKIDVPQAWGLRFFILKELLQRTLNARQEEYRTYSS